MKRPEEIKKGLYELIEHPEKNKPYEAPNGWGTDEGTINFLEWILKDWNRFCG